MKCFIRLQAILYSLKHPAYSKHATTRRAVLAVYTAQLTSANETIHMEKLVVVSNGFPGTRFEACHTDTIPGIWKSAKKQQAATVSAICGRSVPRTTKRCTPEPVSFLTHSGLTVRTLLTLPDRRKTKEQSPFSRSHTPLQLSTRNEFSQNECTQKALQASVWLVGDWREAVIRSPFGVGVSRKWKGGTFLEDPCHESHVSSDGKTHTNSHLGAPIEKGGKSRDGGGGSGAGW